MGLLDMMGSLGGMGDIEKMGAQFVEHMEGTKKRLECVLDNQYAIMEKLGIADKFVDADSKGESENAG